MVPRRIVVGGGVIGLSCARALARRGANVVVLDGSPDAKEASWAAGGILGAGSESVSDTPLFRLARDAYRDLPTAIRELEAETGVSVGRRSDGTLLIAREPGEADALRARDAFLRGHGMEAAWLEPAAALAREPRLARDLLGALWIREGRLDNRRLWQAYEASCRARGVTMRAHEAVTRIVEEGGRVVGVETAAGPLAADTVVLAAGAWSRALATTARLELPTVPVKGQMVRLEAPDGFLSHVVKRAIHYAVPQAGAGLVVGTTAEEVGFDRTLDEKVLARLVEDMATLVPDVRGLRRVEAWAGFRPRLADLFPAIGPVGGRPGLFVATGHYRNGILLAEITGQLIATAVAGGRDDRLAAFSPDRFGPGSGAVPGTGGPAAAPTAPRRPAP